MGAQIRKMVATALAVARGTLTPDFVDATLTRPCRARTPTAPAATLLLADAAFYPFASDTSAKPVAGSWRAPLEGLGGQGRGLWGVHGRVKESMSGFGG